MTLTQTLDAVARREQAARLDAGEAEVLKKVSADLPPPPILDDRVRSDLGSFIDWTTRKNCRYAPAKPFVVSAYLLDIAATGISTGALLRRVNAISVLHDHYNLADPTATTVVRTVLGDLVATGAPRSFNKEEKAEFARAPVPVQRALSRIELSREKHFRQQQNLLSEKLKTANQTVPESSKPSSNESEIENG
jgi:hypothetical protein